VLVDAYRAVRKPRWELEIRRDIARFRSEAHALRDAPKPVSDLGIALLALYRDNVYEAKLGLVLLSALRNAGYAPRVVLPTGRAHRVRRYAHAIGIDDVVALDSIRLIGDERTEINQVMERLLDDTTDFESIKEWAFRGRRIGTHVLSTLIRMTLDGSPDLSLETNRMLLAIILRDVLTTSARSEHIVRTACPTLALIEEANYSINGPLVDVLVANDVDVIQTMSIWRDDALMSKRLTPATRRTDAKSVSPDLFARVLREPWTDDLDRELQRDFEDRYGDKWHLARQFQPDTKERSAAEIIEETGIDPARATAVIFAHVLWDATIFYGEDLFANYSDWLVQTIGAAIRNPEVNWLIKAHPSNVYRRAHGDISGDAAEIRLVREHFSRLPAHVRLLLPDTKISTLSLYKFAAYGVTVRGTPGLEMACFGKPVLTAGTGSYSNLGFTYDSATTSEYFDNLSVLHTFDPLSDSMRDRACRYAHTLFVRRPWTTQSFAMTFPPKAAGYHPLDRNVTITARTQRALRESDDLSGWTTWASKSAEVDYCPRVPAPVPHEGVSSSSQSRPDGDVRLRTPAASVVMPARNAAETIAMQLDALASQRLVGPLEVIVCDNGSDDGTVAIAESWRAQLPLLRILRVDEMPGPSYARNKGIEAATSDRVLLCDADDVVEPSWAASLLARLEEAPLVSGRSIWVDEHLNYLHDDLPFEPRLGFLYSFAACNAALDRPTWRELGGFDEKFKTGQDLDFAWRLQLAGHQIVHENSALVRYRQRGGVRAIFRREFRHGRGTVLIYSRYAPLGMPRSSPMIALKACTLLLLRAPFVWRNPDKKRFWIERAASRAGRIAGSIKYRRLYL
jgi:glycosyltransferase involved in cell wall biosynthesis